MLKQARFRLGGGGGGGGPPQKRGGGGGGGGGGGRYSPIKVTGVLVVPFTGSNLWIGTAWGAKA